MGRASRAEAARHREQVAEAAARLFRERGLAGVSVPDVMAEAGLTHGGFYRHFDSKDTLAATACEVAFANQAIGRADELARHGGDRAAARADLIARYLSPEHRDDPGGGCPNAGLASDAARSPSDSPLRAAFTEGVRASVARLAEPTDQPDGDGTGMPESRTEALADLALMVGAIMLARATAGDPLSEEILAAARARMEPGAPKSA